MLYYIQKYMGNGNQWFTNLNDVQINCHLLKTQTITESMAMFIQNPSCPHEFRKIRYKWLLRFIIIQKKQVITRKACNLAWFHHGESLYCDMNDRKPLFCFYGCYEVTRYRFEITIFFGRMVSKVTTAPCPLLAILPAPKLFILCHFQFPSCS